MQLNYDITVHLSADDVSAIIKDYLLKEKGLVVGKITYDNVKQLCGFGTGEYECINFKGATARCERESPIPKRNSLSAQIAAIETDTNQGNR